MAAAAHFLIRKKPFNSKYPQLQVAKDFAVAGKKLHLATSRRKYDPETKAHQKRSTSGDTTTPSKTSTPEKQQPTQSDTVLVLNKNINHQNLAAMMTRHFQILFHLPRLLRQKLQNLFQRNQNLVQVKSNLRIHESNFFQPDINLLYLLLFLQIYAESRGTNKGTSSLMCIQNFHLVPNVPKFFKISQLFSINYSYFVFQMSRCFMSLSPNFFPHLLLFYVSYSPQQTCAVKTLPLHTPISLVLSFFSFFQ